MLTLTEANTILTKLGLPVICPAAAGRLGRWVIDRDPAGQVYPTVARAFRVAIRHSFINATEPLTKEERLIVDTYLS
jgi:hypothetical protein